MKLRMIFSTLRSDLVLSRECSCMLCSCFLNLKPVAHTFWAPIPAGVAQASLQLLGQMCCSKQAPTHCMPSPPSGCCHQDAGSAAMSDALDLYGSPACLLAKAMQSWLSRANITAIKFDITPLAWQPYMTAMPDKQV